ncbi:MAG: ABC transporter permease [Fusobacteriaceae bacterium]|nr:ABC transporter permease [Fusobacteriaceae bacterium]
MTEKDLENISFLPDDFELVGAAEEAHIDKLYESVGFWREAFMRFRKNIGAVTGLVIILCIVIMALVGPVMSDYTYNSQRIAEQNFAPRVKALEKWGIFDGSETMQMSRGVKEVNRYKEKNLPDTYYWFGSDTLGRDIWTRTWTGTRISLYIALVAVIVDMLFGLSYGLISGYFGGKTDMAMQRFVEVVNGIPNLVIVTLLIIVMKPGLSTITFALMITGWIGMSRIARAQMLRLKEQEFVLASRTLGAPNFFIIFREILPNIFGQLLTNTMFSIPNAIFTEAFLAFIGLGVPAPMASLGSLISEAFKSFTTHPYMIIFPTIVLALLMLSFNLLADGLRDAIDPTLRDR